MEKNELLGLMAVMAINQKPKIIGAEVTIFEKDNKRTMGVFESVDSESIKIKDFTEPIAFNDIEYLYLENVSSEEHNQRKNKRNI